MRVHTSPRRRGILVSAVGIAAVALTLAGCSGTPQGTETPMNRYRCA